MTRYRCNRCKYVYDPAKGDPQAGVPAGTAFSALPESWHCPISGAPKGEFSVLVDKGDQGGKNERAEKTEPVAPPQRLMPAPAPAQKPEVAPIASQSATRNAWTVGSLKKQAGR